MNAAPQDAGTRDWPPFIRDVLRDLDAWLPRLVAGGLAIAAALAFVMALAAPVNHRPELWRGPPDEHGHRAAASFYLQHWLPPRVGDPATHGSYSVEYGLSYVNGTDPAYFLAGKFAVLVAPLVRDHDIAFRLFNVALLAALAALCFRRPGAWPVFVPLLLTPQPWYIFSYFNGDALALFLAIIVAWQVSDRASGFNRFLDAPRARRTALGAAGAGIAIGLLALAKDNYMPFLAFAAALVTFARLGFGAAAILCAAALAGAAWMMAQVPMPPGTIVIAGAVAIAFALAALRPRETRAGRVQVALRLACVAAVALAIYGARHAWDVHLHGSLHLKNAAIGEMRERSARTDYKPSQSAQSTAYEGLYMRQRGVPLAELFGPKWEWHARTFATATGSYGWTEFKASPSYRAALLVAYLTLAALFGVAVLRANLPEGRAAFVLVGVFAAITIAGALMHSWNDDFQAQGRYLFPILPMLGAGLQVVRGHLPRRPFAVTVACCFALSAFSFVFVGLARVPGSFS